MKESVFQYALQNAWANPSEDTPIRLKPARVTGRNGELISFKFLHERYPLPTKDGRYHIYHIGVFPADGILYDAMSRYKWVNMADVISSNKIIFHAYTDDGMIVAPHDVHLLLTNDDGILIAVRKRKTNDIYDKTFFVRYLHNAFYRHPEFSNDDASESQGKLLETDSDLITFRQSLSAHRAKSGYTFLYKNGYLTEGVNNNLQIGDNVSYVYDNSVKQVIEFKLDELDTFPSSRDLNTKYLLHPSLEEYQSDDATFVDDVDFYLMHRGSESKGVLIYRHDFRDDSTLTFRDWGLNYDLVQYLIDITKPIDEYYILAFVRHSGQTKRISYSENLVTELYKLPENLIYDNLSNRVNYISEWTATALEASHYMRLISSRFADVDTTKIIRGFGYNSISKAMGFSTQEKIEESFQLPPALDENVTVFEYDVIGNLINMYYHPAGSYYVPVNDTCNFITALYGKPASDYLIYDSTEFEIVLSKDDDIRVFDCPIVDGEPTLEWEEITNNVDKYIIGSDGKVEWRLDLDGRYAVIVTNELLKVLTYQTYVDEGLVEFTLDSDTGLVPEKVDIFLGNKHLTPDIDYVRNGLDVVITCKDYLKLNETNKFLVVCKGITTDNPKYKIDEKTGFVVNGAIAVDDIYDVKDDKVLLCYADGRLVLKDQIAWEEDGTGIVRTGLNGKPFSVCDAYVALPKLVDYDHYPRRSFGKAIVDDISRLFTDFGLVRDLPHPSVPTDYNLYSPFLSQIIIDVIKGRREPLRDWQSVQDYEDWCQPYFKYLDYDPCRTFTEQQMQYVKIFACLQKDVKVNARTFAFIERINDLFLDGRVIVRDSVSIT